MSSAEQTQSDPGASRGARERARPSSVEIARHLESALGEDPGDGSRFRVALGDVARSCGMMRVSRDTGLAREALYRALSERGNPELATVLKVLKSLGLEVSVRPKPARRRAG